MKVKGLADPIQFTDYLYANDGAASVMGAVRGLRVIVPLMLNPYQAVTIERVDIKVDPPLRGELRRRQGGSRSRPATSFPASETCVKVTSPEHVLRAPKEFIEEVPVDVPARSLAGSIVQLEVVAGDAAKLDSAPPVDLPIAHQCVPSSVAGQCTWAATISSGRRGRRRSTASSCGISRRASADIAAPPESHPARAASTSRSRGPCLPRSA